MNFIFGKCMKVGSCNKGCECFKMSNPASESRRCCGHVQSEHVALGLLGLLPSRDS